MKTMKSLALSTVSVAAVALCTTQAFSAADKDWRTVGGGLDHSKYSTLNQITPANVKNLAKAWSYPAGGSQINPIVINNIVYYPSGTTVYALDGDTGKEIWKVNMNEIIEYAPELVANAARAPAAAGGGGRGATPPPAANAAPPKFVQIGGSAKYGVTYFPGGGKVAPRIVVTARSGYLFQLDAKTGALYKPFGINGAIDLRVNAMEKFNYSDYAPGMLSAVYKNIAVIAPRTSENGRYGPPGDARAFDLTTGKEVWRFHTIPHPGEPNFGGWGMNGWQDRRGPGAWVPMAVDEKNGMVFMPTGNATDQDYGGSRPGDNLYAASLVAIDGETGKLRWYYQFTHHDIYDWDLQGEPALITMKDKDGKSVDAVVQSTKQGYIFVLDRLTGKPLHEIEERVIPASDAPGEFTSKTQPVPVNPGLTVARVGLERDEITGAIPSDKEACLKIYDKVFSAGEGTPYSMVPSLVYPGTTGGPTWAGASYDPNTNLIFINAKNQGQIAMLTPQMSSGVFESLGKSKMPFTAPSGFTCTPGPWGELFAIDAATGNQVWRKTIGVHQAALDKGAVKNPGTENGGGSLVTAGGVLFHGGTQDRTLRAYDPKTGEVIWSSQLPANANATTITWQGKTGKQYIGITSGSREGSTAGDFNVYALPN